MRNDEPSIKTREAPEAMIGVISDTHGYLDPQLYRVFEHAECIIHAGDVGRDQVMVDLGAIAPVFAVRGNVDRDGRLQELPERLDLVVNGFSIHVVHRFDDARPKSSTSVLIYGHSHRPVLECRGNILYVNPGAAGRQGFHVARTAALLELTESPIASLVDLGPRSAVRAPDARRVS